MRTRTLLLLATLLTLGTVAAVGVAAGGEAASRQTPARLGAPSSASLRAAQVLRAWDRRRAATWASGDVAGLARLYTPDSRTGARDVADLRRWHGRHLRVVGLRQQVAILLVRMQTSRRLVLAVTDRTVDGIAVGRRRTALPTSAWATHRIRLWYVHGRWVVDEVVDQPAR